MKAIRTTNTDMLSAIADISPSNAPEAITQRRWDESMHQGRKENKELAWRRGHQAGIHDAYMTLKQDNPRIAERLRNAFEMQKDGSYR